MESSMFNFLKNFFQTKSKPLLDKGWVQSTHLPNTADIALLEMKSSHLVFIVDDLKRQFYHHPLLGENKKFLDRGYTQRNFVYYKVLTEDDHIKYVPFMATPADRLAPHRKILGQIYLVDLDTLTQLDIHYANGLEYIRKRVKIIRPYKEKYIYKSPDGSALPPALQGEKISFEKVQIVDMWMYLGIREVWDDLEGYRFTPVEIYPYLGMNDRSKWLKEFYHLPKPK